MARHHQFLRTIGAHARPIENRAPEPKPKPEPVVIDAEALAEIKATLDALASVTKLPKSLDPDNGNFLPALGRCHECERPVSGERRFCGRCLNHRRRDTG